jgi:D-3-phosphoglycerate dehydrogenase
MTEWQVIVTGETLHADAVTLLENAGVALRYMPNSVTEDDLLGADCADVHALLVRNNPKLGDRLFAAMPALRVIAKHGVGVDSIDIAAAAARGIPVAITSDANSRSVAEHTIALMIALAHNLPRFAARAREGHWDQKGYLGADLDGQTLGIVGFGRIGQRVAAIAAALGMTVVAFDPFSAMMDTSQVARAASLDELVASADIVTLHVPQTETTAGLIDARFLAAMKPGSLLINTARGGLIDEAALLDALTSGHLGGAGLDTLAVEPPPPDHPLLSAPNTLVTPHIAAFTRSAMRAMAVSAATNILATLKGEAIDDRVIVNRPLAKRA